MSCESNRVEDVPVCSLANIPQRGHTVTNDTPRPLPAIVDALRVQAELLQEPEDRNRAASEPLNEMMARLKRRIRRKRSGIIHYDR